MDPAIDGGSYIVWFYFPVYMPWSKSNEMNLWVINPLEDGKYDIIWEKKMRERADIDFIWR